MVLETLITILQNLKGCSKQATPTSSLQMSVMNSSASFMAPGVGANTEKVSSSTCVIVTPEEEGTKPQFGFLSQ